MDEANGISVGRSLEQLVEGSDKSERDERFHRDLIETVKRYPGLYDKYSPDYKKGKDRHEYWSQVETDMFKLGYVAEDTACRHIWRKVVRKFERECILAAKANGSTPYNSPWPHFEAMQFMKPFLREPDEAVQKPVSSANAGLTDSKSADVTLQSLLTKPKGNTKNAQNIQGVQSNHPTLSTPATVCTSQPLFMFVSNPQQTTAAASCSSVRNTSTFSSDSLASLLHEKKRLRIASQRNRWHTLFDVSYNNTNPVASTSVFSVDRDEVMHDLSEPSQSQSRFGDNGDGLKEIIAQMRGAADLIKLLKQRTVNSSPLTNLMSDPRNANFVTTICGLASQLTESQADRFRKRVLVSCFDIFQQVCAEDGELI